MLAPSGSDGASRTNPYERLATRWSGVLPPPPPIATFLTHVNSGRLLFLSGQGPRETNGFLHTGKVGSEVSVAQAYDDARLAGLNLIGVLHAATGDLGRIKKIVKLFGFVNATPDFTDHQKVLNGCSELFVDVFGDRGRHARSAVGVAALPGNISVEIEAVVELGD